MAEHFTSLPVYSKYMGTAETDDPRKLIVPIGSLHRDPTNPNDHPDRNKRGIRASLRRRGQQSPLVVDRDGMIIVGNGRHECMELEGWRYCWIVVTDLTGAELRAYGIADNQTGRTSENNWELLATHIQDLKAFDDTEFAFSNDDLGFEEHELSPMLHADWSPQLASDEPGPSQASVSHVDGPPGPETEQAPPPLREVAPPPPDADDRATNKTAIACTPNHRLTIDPAIDRVRTISGDMAMSEGRCIELICADYLAGA